MITLSAHHAEQLCNGCDRRAGQGEVIAHAVDIATVTAEVDLHIDDDQHRVVGPQFAVIGPRIGIGFDDGFHDDQLPLQVGTAACVLWQRS